MSILHCVTSLTSNLLRTNFLRMLGLNINRKNKRGNTALFKAIKLQNRKMVSRLLEHGASVRVQNNDRDTPLHCAVKLDDPVIVKLLLERNCELRAFNDRGDTPLHSAVRTGNLKAVKLLIKNNGHLASVKNLYNKRTPLDLSVYSDNSEIVSLLIRHFNVEELSPKLLYAAIQSRSCATVKVLLEANFNADPSVYPKSVTPLIQISEISRPETVDQDYEMIELLVNHGADLFKICCSRRFTILHNLAVRNFGNSHYELFEYLLSKGLDPNSKNSFGDTPFHLVVGNCSVEICKLFLRHGAEAAAKNNLGATAMHHIGDQRHPEIIQLLLKHGDSVTSRCKNRKTVLQLATRHENVPIIRLLLENGAGVDLDVFDNSREIPLLVLLIGYRYNPIITRVEIDRINEIMRLFLIYGTNLNALCAKFGNALFQYTTSYRNGTWKTMIEHVLVMRASGQWVDPSIFREIENYDKYKEYQLQCESELCRAQQDSLGIFTVHDVLVTKRNKFRTCFQKFEKIMNSESFIKKYPIYHSYIVEKFKMGTNYLELRDKAELFLQNFYPISQLPDLVIDKIISYLSLSDLSKYNLHLKSKCCEELPKKCDC